MKHSVWISGVASAALIASLAIAQAQTKAGEMGGAPTGAAGASEPTGGGNHSGAQGGVHAPARGDAVNTSGKEQAMPKTAEEPKAGGKEAPDQRAQEKAGPKEGAVRNSEQEHKASSARRDDGADVARERTGLNERDKNAVTPNDRNGAGGVNQRNGSGEASGRSVAKEGANITPEQRTQVRSEISHAQVREAPNLNISVHVGGVVPRTITEYWEPIPTDIVTVVPAWRAYRVVRIGDEILIIDPNSFEIVDVL